MRFFKARYESILAGKKTADDEFFPNLPGYDERRVRYYQHIESQLEQVNAFIAVLNQRFRARFEDRIRETNPESKKEER